MLLEGKNLIPSQFDEQNWSGRGMHAEFELNEASEIPLKPIMVLGHTSSAFVEAVLCRRILLARKTIDCRRRMTREEAIVEVENLQRLKHTHIVRVVGTYVFAKNLSILLYPVAEYSLDSFIDELLAPKRSESFAMMEKSMRGFFGCLSSTLNFIHGSFTKHLDIKPKNLLIKDMGSKGIRTRAGSSLLLRYKIIVADFGISRFYNSAEELETESPVSFTKTYAAPEVVEQRRRGPAADTFSLGCVYAELVACFATTTIESFIRAGRLKNAYAIQDELIPKINIRDCWIELQNSRLGNEFGDVSYQANIPQVIRVVTQACCDIPRFRDLLRPDEFEILCGYIRSMLNILPEYRPEMDVLASFFNSTGFLFPCRCCTDPDPFEVSELAL
jgi:serine/threonine protein kinase